MHISSLLWLDVVNPVLHPVWHGQNFLPVFFLFFKIWMISPVCPRSVPIIVAKGVDPPSASSASCWWKEWIRIHPSGSVRQHSWCVRQKCQG
ncbi:unnamed protein product [Prunus armeniaca]